MQLFKLAFEALMCDNVNEKLSLTSQLNSSMFAWIQSLISLMSKKLIYLADL